MSGRTNSLAPEQRDALRARLVDAIPPRYSPAFHLLFPSTVAVGLIATSLALLHDVRAWQLLMVPLTFLFQNAGEWSIHKYLLHRRTPPLALLYDRHTPEHHMVYITEDMAMRSRREFRLVLIPPWGIVVAFVAALPIPLALIWLGQWNLAMFFVATTMFYVASYEWMHLSYHLPPDSFIGRMKIVAFLRRHHATHHDPTLMQKWNFNVTLPLWDFVRGTIWKPDRVTKAVHKAV